MNRASKDVQVMSNSYVSSVVKEQTFLLSVCTRLRVAAL